MKGFVPPPRFGGATHFSDEPLPITREISVTEGISVKDLAEKLEIRAKDLIAALLMRGVFVTVNQSLDAAMVKDVAAKFGAGATVISYEEELENEAIEEVLDSRELPTSSKYHARRSSLSWVTLTMARHRCSTRFARPMWRLAKPAALRNTSALTR